MPRHTQIFGRLGNKMNDLKYFKHLVPTDAKTIVEPFCGSCAMTLTLFADHTKYQYHFNDLDPNLFAIINDVNGYLKFKADVVQMHNDFMSDHDTETTPQLAKLWKSTVQSIDSPFTNFYVNEKFIRSALFKITKDNPDTNHVTIFEKATKTNDDYKTVMEQYRWDKEAFIFLDPPYLFSDNSGYYPQREDSDMTDIIVFILDFFASCSCKVMLIINDLKILRYLFRKHINGDYLRTYQLGKRKAKHLIITNYELNPTLALPEPKRIKTNP